MSYQPSGKFLPGAAWPIGLRGSSRQQAGLAASAQRKSRGRVSSSSINPQILQHLMKRATLAADAKVEKATQTLMLSADGILRVCKMREPVCRRETHES